MENTITIQTETISQSTVAENLKRLVDLVNYNESVKNIFKDEEFKKTFQEQLYKDYQTLRRINAMIEDRIGGFDDE